MQGELPNGGMPTIRVTAHDFLQRLTHGKLDRSFAITIPETVIIPLPDPLVAAIVSGTNLLIPSLDPVGAALSTLMTLGNLRGGGRQSHRSAEIGKNAGQRI